MCVMTGAASQHITQNHRGMVALCSLHLFGGILESQSQFLASQQQIGAAWCDSNWAGCGSFSEHWGDVRFRSFSGTEECCSGKTLRAVGMREGLIVSKVKPTAVLSSPATALVRAGTPGKSSRQVSLHLYLRSKRINRMMALQYLLKILHVIRSS